MSWYERGKKGQQKAAKKDQEAKVRRESRGGPMRFFQKSDESCKITFLDTPDFFFSEHHLKINGRWGNFFTCRNDWDECPLCDAGETPSYVLVATIISHKEWVDRENRVRKNQKMLLVLKGKAREKMIREIERRGGNLKGCVYEVARGSSSTEASTGEDFAYIKKLKVEVLKKLIPADVKDTKDEKARTNYLKPFDYGKIFEPQSVAALRKIAGVDAPVGSDEDDVDDLVAGDGVEEEVVEEETVEEEQSWDEYLAPMNRAKLKKVIVDEKLPVKVFSNQSDDVVRENVLNALLEKYPAEEAVEEESLEEELGEEEAVEEEVVEEETAEPDSIDALL